MKKRVVAVTWSAPTARACHGKRLRREALSVTFAGLDIAELSRLPLERLAELSCSRTPTARAASTASLADGASGEGDRRRSASPRDLVRAARRAARPRPRLPGAGAQHADASPGELQRLRLATQVRSNLFGVVYVLDEPSAGLHPADTEALLRALDRLKAAGNSLFVVEHELDVIRHADWIVDVGPAAGEQGGEVLYSGPPDGLAAIDGLADRGATCSERSAGPPRRAARARGAGCGWPASRRNNLHDLDVAFPLGVLHRGHRRLGLGQVEPGQPGAGRAGRRRTSGRSVARGRRGRRRAGAGGRRAPAAGASSAAWRAVNRLVRVDQKPIGRTPRSNLATYTGLFDHVRKLFAATKAARGAPLRRRALLVQRRQGPLRRPARAKGFVMVELLFLPSVYAPCPTCHGARYNAKTLEITVPRQEHRRGARPDRRRRPADFFADEPPVQRALRVLREVGLGYLRLGQPATELSGGEAQRIKLATELQRAAARRHALRPRRADHRPASRRRRAADARSSTGWSTPATRSIVVEHDMRVVAASDWVIDIGPGAGDEGGRIVSSGSPLDLARDPRSRTAPFLDRFLAEAG